MDDLYLRHFVVFEPSADSGGELVGHGHDGAGQTHLEGLFSTIRLWFLTRKVGRICEDSLRKFCSQLGPTSADFSKALNMAAM